MGAPMRRSDPGSGADARSGGRGGAGSPRAGSRSRPWPWDRPAAPSGPALPTHVLDQDCQPARSDPFDSVPSTGCAWKIGGPLTGAQTNKPPADRPARRPGWLGRAFDLYFRGGWSEAMAAEGDTSYRDAFRDPLIGHETLVAIAGRRLEPLGPWRLTLDVFEEGLRQNWPALDEKPPAGWTLPRDYDLAGGTPVEVPSCWNLNRPEWRHFEGMGWYATHFEARPERPGERTFLRIGAANYETRVFLNGRFLGRHLGGSTPFCVELTQALVPGTNRLQIAVDNRRKADRVPAGPFRLVQLWRAVSGGRTPAAAPRLHPRGERDAGPGRKPVHAARRRRPVRQGERRRRSVDSGALHRLGSSGEGRDRNGDHRREPRALVPVAAEALPCRDPVRRRYRFRPDRLPRDPRRQSRHPSERKADLSARDLRPRGRCQPRQGVDG